MSPESLNGNNQTFDEMVQSGEIKLLTTPNNVVKAQLGEEVKLDGKFPAYRATWSGTEAKLTVNLDSTVKPRGHYKVIERGIVEAVRYRDPNDDKTKIGSSDKTSFAILRRPHLKGSYICAFYVPD